MEDQLKRLTDQLNELQSKFEQLNNTLEEIKAQVTDTNHYINYIENEFSVDEEPFYNPNEDTLHDNYYDYEDEDDGNYWNNDWSNGEEEPYNEWYPENDYYPPPDFY